MTRKNKILALLFGSAMLCAMNACKQTSDTAESQEKGVGGSFLRKTLALRPIPSSQMRSAVKSLVERLGSRSVKSGSLSPSDGKRLLMETIFLQIVAEGGMPRWQVRSLLSNVIDPDRALCGGASCARVFGLKREEIEDYLDGMLETVQKDPRLRDKDHQKTFQVLLASLESDLKVPRKGQPSQKIAFFSEAVADSAQKSLGKLEGMTYGDLDRVTHLEISRVRNMPLRLDEVGMFPRLKSISFKVWDLEDLEELVRVAHLVDEIQISHPFVSKAQEVRLSDLEILSDFTTFKSVGLSDIRIDRPELLPKIFPRARSLHIENFNRAKDPLSDSLLAAIVKMPFLRQLKLGVYGIDRLENLSLVVPKSIADIHVNLHPQGVRDCGSLAIFGIFRNASSFKVSRCGLRGVAGLGAPVAWKALILDRPFNAANVGQPLELSLGPELKGLLIFHSNEGTIQLDEISRHELVTRLALAEKP